MNLPSQYAVTSSLIAASAGTGKTYRLTLRYLALLALGVLPESLIALTFTNKAAGEFRSRILSRLAEGAESPEGAAKLAAALVETFHSAADSDFPPLVLGNAPDAAMMNCDFFRQKLLELIQAMSRLNLSTYDSFFNALVMRYKNELGLTSVKLLTDSEKRRARRGALMAMFNWINDHDEVLEGFLQLMTEVLHLHSGDVVEEMLALVDTFREFYMQDPSRAASTWGNAAAFGFAPDKCTPNYRIPASELDELKQRLNELIPLMKGNGNVINDLKGVVDRFRKNQPAGQRVLNDKADKANEALREGLTLVRSYHEKLKRQVLSLQIARTIGIAKAIAQYEHMYAYHVHSRGQMEFSDITRLVPRLMENEGNATYLSYKLGGRLRHWMLDEFQDTSPEQWKAITPFIEPIADTVGSHADHCGNESLFVVGDVKQSIYGFRGTDSSLFAALSEKEPWHSALRKCPMVRSFRSSPIIMDFVNKVFTPLPLIRDFPQHETARDYPGYVSVQSVESQSGNENIYAKIGSIVSELWPRQMSIGILTRTNEESKEIATWLRRYLPHISVSLVADVPAATESPVGVLLNTFFLWLKHPGDSYRKALLKVSPLRHLLNTPTAWSEWRRLLEQDGYGAVLHRIRDSIATQENLNGAGHAAQIRTWLIAAAHFDTVGGTLDEWLIYTADLKQRTNPPEHHVQIMTKHKSKGLQFDAVILPLISGKAYNDAKCAKVLLTDNSSQQQGLLIPPASDWRKIMPEFEAAFEQWSDSQKKEGYNTLYVALTRAIRANYVLVKQGATASTTDAGVILKSVERENAKNEGILFEQPGGSPIWYECMPLRKNEPMQTFSLPTLAPTARRYRYLPSQAEGAAERSERYLNAPPSSIDTTNAAELGTEVHALFEQLERLQPGELPNWEHTPQNTAQQMVLRALQEKEIAALFTLPHDAEVYNEQAIEAVSQDKWTSAVIDRLVVQGDKASIYDYKTNAQRGRDRETFDADLRSKYQNQMSDYRKLVAQALGVSMDNVSASLVAVGCDTPHIIPM